MKSFNSSREKWCCYAGAFGCIIPAMIASGFMPICDVFSPTTWLLVATIIPGIAGAVATPFWTRGLVSGALTGVGVFGAVGLYVAFRTSLIDADKFLKLELGIATCIGGAPGTLLYTRWARIDETKIEGTHASLGEA